MILLATAFVCFILEAAGSSIGRHKTGDRFYIILTALLGLFATAYLTPLNLETSTCLLFALMSLALAYSQLKYSGIEFGEAYAFILVLCALQLHLLNNSRWINFVTLTALSNIILVGLSYFRRNRRISAEIGLKFLIVAMFVFCLLSIGIVLSIEEKWRLSSVFFWIGLLLYLGVTPFSNAHIDYLEAAPGFASIQFIATTLISSTGMIKYLVSQKLDPNLYDILYIFATISIIVPAILAFDQQKIGRLIAYLFASQAGLLLLLALTQSPSISVVFFHLALIAPAIFAGIRFWKHSQNSDKSWEDYAGAGQKHPIIGMAWLYALSSLAGSPFTVGFWIYQQLAHSAELTKQHWIFPLIVAGILLNMFPVARLAVFMFGKPTHHEMMRHHEPRQSFIVLTGALAAAVSYGVLTLSPTIYETLFK